MFDAIWPLQTFSLHGTNRYYITFFEYYMFNFALSAKSALKAVCFDIIML